MIVRELFARLGMKTDAASFKRADKSLDRVKKAAAAIAAIFIGGRVVRGFSNLITETVAAADSVVQTSEKLGVGAQALQEYQFAAQAASVPIRTFNMGLQRFARRTAEAAKGTGEAKDALREMGIQLRDNQGRLRPADDLLLDVADSISKVSDEGEKVRLAFKLFDSEGVALINMLKGGSGALKEMRKEARETGGIFSDEFLKASTEMSVQLLRLEMSTRSLKVMFVNALFPALNAGIDWFMRTTRAIQNALKGTKLLEVALGALAAAATVLVFILGFKLLGAVGGLALSLVSLAGGFTTAGAAALLMQIKMIAIGAVFILLTALILLLAEEVVGAFTGMDTAGGRVSDMLSDLYDDFMKLGESNSVIEALLLPLKAFLTALRLSKDALFALVMLMTGDTSGLKLLGEDLAEDAEKFHEANKRIVTSIGSTFKEGNVELGRVLGIGTPATPGILPSPQAAAAGAGPVTINQQVTVDQTVQGTSDPATTAKMAGENIRQVLSEENKKALQMMTATKGRGF